MDYPSPRDDSGFLSPTNDLTATPRYAIPDTKGYTHTRGGEVEQKDEGIQVNDCNEDKGSIEYLVKWITNRLPGSDQQMLWDGFCTFDYYFAGTLDRFELTAFLKYVDPAARARDISRWVQELDTADDESDSANSEISFVELLDWWERSTRAQKDKVPSASKTAEVTRRVKDAQSALHSRAKLEYLNMSNFYGKSYISRIHDMSPGDLSRSVETLMSTSLQVCSWVQEHHHKEAEFHERSLFLAARAAGKHAGLSESDYDKYCFLFRQYLSLQEPRNGPVEESVLSDTPPDSARTNVTDGLSASFRSAAGTDCNNIKSLDELKNDLKECIGELTTARESYHHSLLAEEDGGVDEIRDLQEKISQLEIREKSLQKSILSQKNCPGPTAMLNKTSNLLHTICVDKDLTPLSNLVGVKSNFCETSIMKSSGIYKQRMDSHSFLCYIAVRFGKS